MLRIIGRRLLGSVPVLLALAFVLFVLQQIAPVDPVVGIVGTNARPEVYERVREEMGLNDPLPQQYVRYVSDAVQGDLGTSVVTRRPVTSDLRVFLAASFELVGFAFVLVAGFGLLLGVATARRWRGSGVLRSLMVGLSSAPTFLVALIALIIFYRHLNWLPASGRTGIDDAPIGPTGLLTVDGLLRGRLDVTLDALHHLILPAACLAIVSAVSVGRVFRSSLLQVDRSDHVRTARAKGLRESRVLGRHSMRNAISPVLALWGMQLAWLFAAALIIEKIFAFPGVGLYVSQAIDRGDFNTIAGVTLALGVVYVVSNIAVDALQAVADPRVRL